MAATAAGTGNDPTGPNRSEPINSGNGQCSGNWGKPGATEARDKPRLLDLDGDGIEITELSRSNVFMDAGGDGLLHRTAWAGVGDGVLFFDANNDNRIGEKREYVFTEWDPTASSDLAALRSAFDRNGDGKLTAADANFARFKVMVTNADGSQTARTLAQLGIRDISLLGDTTEITLPDGSVITGQSNFTLTNGTTGTVADMILVADADGRRVVQTVSTLTSVTSRIGQSVTLRHDDDDDGNIDLEWLQRNAAIPVSISPLQFADFR